LFICNVASFNSDQLFIICTYCRCNNDNIVCLTNAHTICIIWQCAIFVNCQYKTEYTISNFAIMDILEIKPILNALCEFISPYMPRHTIQHIICVNKGTTVFNSLTCITGNFCNQKMHFTSPQHLILHLSLAYILKWIMCNWYKLPYNDRDTIFAIFCNYTEIQITHNTYMQMLQYFQVQYELHSQWGLINMEIYVNKSEVYLDLCQ
ncbi:unnamed protein product, partial [Meganyctiphanes norvegica]